MRLVQRFIPTRVGNTLQGGSPPRRATVHPHASGEHTTPGSTAASPSGSSPREWGTQQAEDGQVVVARFIPTRVGNTATRTLCEPSTPVHPHASGEHTAATNLGCMRNGSSPREWGTRGAIWRWRAISRFIPTRVGNTLLTIACCLLSAVHPHASGEHGKRYK